MRFWLSHVRNLETLAHEFATMVPAWRDAGVSGVVVGPMLFGCGQRLSHTGGTRFFREPMDPRATFDPDPRWYRSLGTAPPAAPDGDDGALRAALGRAFDSIRDADLELWLFDPFTGAPGDLNDNGDRILPGVTQDAMMARMVDTVAAYPAASGVIVDGPAWGFEIAEIGMAQMRNRRSLFEVPGDDGAAAALNLDAADVRAAAAAVAARLHQLTDADSNRDQHDLFGDALTRLTSFRTATLTALYRTVAETLVSASDGPHAFAVCPRTPALASLAGYDYAAVARIADVVMPKLYYWHRGYDGLVGTYWRWVHTLCNWNPGLSVRAAAAVTRAVLGDAVPLVERLAEFDVMVDSSFLARVTAHELDAVRRETADATARIVPWLDSGRAPHDGDPITARELAATLDAVEAGGVQEFCYFSSTNVPVSDWVVLSERCGQAWTPSAGWTPPDEPTV